MKSAHRTIEIRDGDELIRAVLFKNSVPSGIFSVQREDTRSVQHDVTYLIQQGVILSLIEREWVIAKDENHMHNHFIFNYDRAYEWLAIEEMRINSCLAKLVDRFPNKHFNKLHYCIAQHPHSSEHDVRGFAFADENENCYLVCEGGRIVPLLHHTYIR